MSSNKRTRNSIAVGRKSHDIGAINVKDQVDLGDHAVEQYKIRGLSSELDSESRVKYPVIRKHDLPDRLRHGRVRVVDYLGLGCIGVGNDDKEPLIVHIVSRH